MPNFIKYRISTQHDDNLKRLIDTYLKDNWENEKITIIKSGPKGEIKSTITVDKLLTNTKMKADVFKHRITNDIYLWYDPDDRHVYSYKYKYGANFITSTDILSECDYGGFYDDNNVKIDFISFTSRLKQLTIDPSYASKLVALNVVNALQVMEANANGNDGPTDTKTGANTNYIPMGTVVTTGDKALMITNNPLHNAKFNEKVAAVNRILSKVDISNVQLPISVNEAVIADVADAMQTINGLVESQDLKNSVENFNGKMLEIGTGNTIVMSNEAASKGVTSNVDVGQTQQSIPPNIINVQIELTDKKANEIQKIIDEQSVDDRPTKMELVSSLMGVSAITDTMNWLNGTIEKIKDAAPSDVVHMNSVLNETLSFDNISDSQNGIIKPNPDPKITGNAIEKKLDAIITKTNTELKPLIDSQKKAIYDKSKIISQTILNPTGSMPVANKSGSDEGMSNLAITGDAIDKKELVQDDEDLLNVSEYSIPTMDKLIIHLPTLEKFKLTRSVLTLTERLSVKHSIMSGDKIPRKIYNKLMSDFDVSNVFDKDISISLDSKKATCSMPKMINNEMAYTWCTTMRPLTYFEFSSLIFSKDQNSLLQNLLVIQRSIKNGLWFPFYVFPELYKVYDYTDPLPNKWYTAINNMINCVKRMPEVSDDATTSLIKHVLLAGDVISFTFTTYDAQQILESVPINEITAAPGAPQKIDAKQLIWQVMNKYHYKQLLTNSILESCMGNTIDVGYPLLQAIVYESIYDVSSCTLYAPDDTTFQLSISLKRKRDWVFNMTNSENKLFWFLRCCENL